MDERDPSRIVQRAMIDRMFFRMGKSPRWVYHNSMGNSKIPCMTQWIRITGVLAQGYRVASGPSADYPYGALDRQRPIFKARGFDLDGYFNGTLSIDIGPQTFKMEKPQYTF